MAGEAEPKRDLEKMMFDLNRSTLIKSMVDRMESCLREAQAARDDLKEVASECKEREFTRREIEAMRTIAKLRLDDKKGTAQEKLDALERIGKAVSFDLFDWSAARAA